HHGHCGLGDAREPRDVRLRHPPSACHRVLLDLCATAKRVLRKTTMAVAAVRLGLCVSFAGNGSAVRPVSPIGAERTSVSDVVVGVDLGGTKTAAALVDAAGAIGPVRSVATPAQAGPAAVLDAVAGLVRDVVARG